MTPWSVGTAVADAVGAVMAEGATASGGAALALATAATALSAGGLGAMRVLVSRGQRIPIANPTTPTMPTFPHAGRSASGEGISTARGVSWRGIAVLSLAQGPKIWPKVAENSAALGRPHARADCAAPDRALSW
jgi:hypothetical protein